MKVVAPTRDPWQGLARRLWDAPLWAHGVMLAIVLVALIPVVGPQASFSADEGAAIVQARSLAHGEGWTVAHPFPEADPTSRYYPLALSEHGSNGTAPFAKHPLYALVLAGAFVFGGMAAMVALSVMGTVAAATLGAALGRHLHPLLPRPTLWVLGLGSPLLFDGYLLIAHSIGAAAAAGAALLAVRAIENRRWTLGLAVGPVVAVAVLLRSEAALFGLALAVTAAAVGLVKADHRWPALGVAVAAAGAAVVARVGEQAWARHIVGAGTGTGPAQPGYEDPLGLVEGRLQAFSLTWLDPSYSGSSLLEALLLLMAVSVGAAAVIVRRRQGDSRSAQAARAAAVVAAAASVAALVVSPRNVVPGLLVAFPVGLAGLLLLDRRTVASLPARALAGTFALFSLAVLATQYSRGGTAEWGGRYFALGLPLLAPLALDALRQHGARLDRETARRAGGALAVCSLALAVMAVSALRGSHQRTDELVAAFAATGRASVAVAGEKPVLVATMGAVPRLSWSTFDDQRWLLAPPEELDDVLDGVRAAGVYRVALVTNNLGRDRLAWGEGVSVTATVASPRAPWDLLVLDLGP
jgi:hypothetical protein